MMNNRKVLDMIGVVKTSRTTKRVQPRANAGMNFDAYVSVD